MFCLFCFSLILSKSARNFSCAPPCRRARRRTPRRRTPGRLEEVADQPRTGAVCHDGGRGRGVCRKRRTANLLLETDANFARHWPLPTGAIAALSNGDKRVVAQRAVQLKATTTLPDDRVDFLARYIQILPRARNRLPLSPLPLSAAHSASDDGTA